MYVLKSLNVCELVAALPVSLVYITILFPTAVTALSDTLLVHLSGFVHPTRSSVSSSLHLLIYNAMQTFIVL